MRITWTVVADCDPPPEDEWLLGPTFELLSVDLEDDVAAGLVDSGAGFSVKATATVEP